MITFFETGGYTLNQPNEKPHCSNLSPGVKNESDPAAFKGQYVEILIKGQPSEIWADWFEGLTIEYLDNEEMRLSGYIMDQSALMGIMNKLVRLNLTLISLNEKKE